jgi:hypothetical protein
MKKLILLLLPVFLLQPLFGQKIHYEKSFQIALAKASAQNKPVFLQISAPKPPNVPKPSFVNFESGLEDKNVATKYNNSFINYQVAVTDTAANQFRKKYQIPLYPAYFFLDKNNNLIYRDDKNSSTGKKYLDMADAALKQFSTGKNLSNYDETYKKGKLDAAFLKEYISKREQLGIYDNAKLIDQYVEYLPVSALNDYQTVLFILKAGPYAFGKTAMLASTNKQVYDSIYKTEPLADRVAINNRSINNTYKEAVNTKNAALAQQAANYSRNTHSKDYRQATIASTKLLLQYYTAVKDTANYLRQATYFYDNYYMNISADSAKKLELAKSTAQLNMLNNGKKVFFTDNMKKTTPENTRKDTVIVREGFFTATPAFDVANELNNAAYSFYSTGTTNPNYLSKAIIWSRRSILFNPIFAYYDTLAHLLYRYNFYAEAEVNQNLAVELAKKNAPIEAERMKKELEKIKKRIL